MLLDVVEALSVDTDDSRLCHEGVRVYFVDKLKDEVRLAFLRYAEDHFFVFLGEEAVAVEHRTAAVGNLVDGFTYLLIFVGDDEELHALA